MKHTFNPNDRIKPGEFNWPTMRTTIPEITEVHPVAFGVNLEGETEEVVFCVHTEDGDSDKLIVPRKLLADTDLEGGCELVKGFAERNARAVWN